MSNLTPRVSVGLAVYNGENYLREAIDSILAQTFTDFELILSDNASTDKTQEICLEYAAKDNRIRYYCNDRNMGAAWNQTRVYELARGEYYKLAAHDDLITPDFLEKCVKALDQNPSAVLCHSWTRKIDRDGNILEDQGDGSYIPNYPSYIRFIKRVLQPLLGDGKTHFDSPSPRVRFRSQIGTYNSCYHIFGLMRVSALKQTPGLENYSHSDGVLLARLALLGKFCEIPEYLFISRKHAGQSEQMFLLDMKSYAVWWDPDNAGKISVPRWRIFRELCKAIDAYPLPLSERLWCYFDALRWLRGCWALLLQEAIGALIQLLAARFGKSKRLEETAI